MEQHLKVPLHEFLASGSFVGLEGGRFLIGWGHCKDSLAPVEGHLNIFSPNYFCNRAANWKVFSQFGFFSASDLEPLLASVAQRATIRWSEWLSEGFRSDFIEVQELIRSGILRKGVPFVMAKGSGRVAGPARAHILHKLLHVPGNLTAYGIWNEQEGMLGATPEILFELCHNELHTMALAGTQSREDEAEQFMRDPKQLEEHNLVVADICERLGSYGRVQTEKLRILELPRLRHLLTEISVKLTQTLDVQTAAELLHPTPALGAFPREAGWKWLEGIETKQPRRRFGAPFGVQVDEIRKCWVAIRNIQWQGERVELGVGCGIVAGSHFESEWEELRLKRDSVLQLMDL